MKRFVRCSFLLFVLTGPVVQAQRSAIGWVVGISNSTYEFDEPVRLPGTSNRFLWHADYSKTDVLLGGDWTYRLSKHWQLKTGARVATSGYEQEYSFGTIVELGDGNFTTLPNDRLSVNHLFVQTPLMVRYLIWQKKWSPYVETGFDVNTYLITRQAERIGDRSKVVWKNTDTVHPVNLNAALAAGFQIRCSENACWFFECTGRYQLVRVEKGIRNPLLNWGAAAGWRVQLKK